MEFTHSHCCYCRRKFSETEKHLRKTNDHFIPKSRSGVDESENLLQCCQECNAWKADRLPAYWLNHVEYFKNRRKKHGYYKIVDYSQIIGSLRHFIKHFKDKNVSEYKSI